VKRSESPAPTAGENSVNQNEPAVIADAQILVVDRDRKAVRVLTDTLTPHGVHCDHAENAESAGQMLENDRYDLLIVSDALPDGSCFDLKRRLDSADRCARVIIISDHASFGEAVVAMRAGVSDFITKPFEKRDLEDRVTHALTMVYDDRRRERRVRRLRQLCKRLNTARLDVSSQVDNLCNDLVSAYQDLAEQISHVTIVTEFGAIVKQELEVEELLRTTLEYFLQKFGPMNAAVFLPGIEDDDFTLGAYINYDCPKQTADFLLDHLADVIAPKMVDEPELRQFKDVDSLTEWIGDDAAWLADSHVIAFTCRHEGRILAIFTLFRDKSTPFSADIGSVMNSIAEVFAKQMALVIHVHHRAVGGPEWCDDADGFDFPTLHDDDDQDDDHDCESDGGLAA
jgi:DNA-binding response OmpR family regulator